MRRAKHYDGTNLESRTDGRSDPNDCSARTPCSWVANRFAPYCRAVEEVGHGNEKNAGKYERSRCRAGRLQCTRRNYFILLHR